VWHKPVAPKVKLAERLDLFTAAPSLADLGRNANNGFGSATLRLGPALHVGASFDLPALTSPSLPLAIVAPLPLVTPVITPVAPSSDLAISAEVPAKKKSSAIDISPSRRLATTTSPIDVLGHAGRTSDKSTGDKSAKGRDASGWGRVGDDIGQGVGEDVDRQRVGQHWRARGEGCPPLMEPRRALDLSVQDVIYAGLDALLAVAPLDLCAYLHLAETTGPQLFLGAPALSSIDGQRAFDVFSELRDELDRPLWTDDSAADRVAESMTIAGFHALVVVTFGAHSRGVHAFGLVRGELAPATRDASIHLANALGVATHRLQSATEMAHVGAAGSPPA
jgi:hypothetical protein